jgi:hypothetical protein
MNVNENLHVAVATITNLKVNQCLVALRATASRDKIIKISLSLTYIKTLVSAK